MAQPKRWGSDLEAIVKSAVEKSGLSLAELARQSGVSHPQLSRFMRGERTLTLTSATKLFEALGLEVVGADRPSVRPPKQEPVPPKRGKKK